MSNLHHPLAIFTLLILCLVSVWSAPVFPGTDIPFMDFTETESDPFEFEEDLYLATCGNDGLMNTVRIRIGGTYLNRHPAFLARVFSPPRPFYS